MKKIINNPNFLLLAAALGIMLRFIIICIGNNFDFESYIIVGDIVKKGGNVYAQTSRYNYGPLFFLIQGILYSVSSVFADDARRILCYRLLMVSFLTAADLGLMFYVKNKTNHIWAAVFFLNPISIIITGYHNQFDNWAVLLAVIGTEYLLSGTRNKEGWNKCDILGICFLSLSMIMKHILYAFPIWLLFSKKIEWKKKFIYGILPPFFSCCHFFRLQNQGGKESWNMFFYIVHTIITRCLELGL